MTMATCRSDLASRVRALVSARDAAERYGFTPNRAGYICCPFHSERTPSLKLFPDGGWHCFGCGKGGSSIDFVMELFGVDFRQAVVRLDMDFSLGLTGERPIPTVPSAILEARRKERERRRELEAEMEIFTKEHYRLHRNRQLYAPSGLSTEQDFHPLFVEALKKLPEVQYRLEELENELRRMEHGENRNSGVPARGLSGNDHSVRVAI